LTPAIIYRDIIYALYPSSTPPPPKTTAIFRDFKKSTAMCKVHNVGLWYIKAFYILVSLSIANPLWYSCRLFLTVKHHGINGHFYHFVITGGF
jgi:hypothetical protein